MCRIIIVGVAGYAAHQIECPLPRVYRLATLEYSHCSDGCQRFERSLCRGADGKEELHRGRDQSPAADIGTGMRISKQKSHDIFFYPLYLSSPVLLQQGGVGMRESLVDAEGFPRADIDVFAVRTARNRIICECQVSVLYLLMSQSYTEIFRNVMATVIYCPISFGPSPQVSATTTRQ